MRTHYVIFGSGAQSLTIVPTGEDGEPVAPSAATYGIVDLRHTETSTDRVVVASGTAASIDATTATLTGGAGTGAADKTRIELDSVTGFIEGSPYVLERGDGMREVVIADRIDTSALCVYTRQRIRRSYPSGSVLRGASVTATFPAIEADDEAELEDGAGPYAIDWSLSGLTPPEARDLIWIRRHADRVYADVRDVRMIDQTIGNVSRETVSLEVCLQQAHRDTRANMRELGIDPDVFHGGENLRDAVAYRAAAIARAHIGGERDREMADDYNVRSRSLLATMTPHGTVVTDKGDDNALPGSTSVEFPYFELT